MIFKDRNEAGRKLAETITQDKEIFQNRNNLVVLSLVRGGLVVGAQIAKRLKCPHYPLVVKKIGAPGQEELAIGAVCDDEYFLDEALISRLGLSRKEVEKQTKKAKEKQKEYSEKFKFQSSNIKNKTTILTDDGVATGASVQAAVKYLKKLKPHKIILAVPVAPSDFDESSFDKIFILHKDPDFHAVGQFYRVF